MAKSSTVQFPGGEAQASRNGRGGNGYPDDADARYAAALKLVQVIDSNLRKGTHPYYNTHGRLLQTLDEVIHAMLTDSLAVHEPSRYPHESETARWVPIAELVA